MGGALQLPLLAKLRERDIHFVQLPICLGAARLNPVLESRTVPTPKVLTGDGVYRVGVTV